MACTVELTSKLVPYSEQAANEITWSNIFKICITGLEDDAWFIRENAAKLVGVIYGRGSQVDEVFGLYVEPLVNMLLVDVVDSMQHLRTSACSAIGHIIAWSNGSKYRTGIIAMCTDSLATNHSLLDIAECLTIGDSSDGVVRRIAGNDSYHVDQPMYSCGSLMSNACLRRKHGHSLSDECCSGHDLPRSTKKWQVIDGALKLYFILTTCVGGERGLARLHKAYTSFIVAVCSSDVPIIPTIQATIKGGLSQDRIIASLRDCLTSGEYSIIASWIRDYPNDQ
jgi:hypothetical protein